MNLLYAQTGLQLFERYLFRLRVEVQHNNKLESHHRCKEQKRETARRICPERKSSGDQGVHDPVRGAAETLAFCANARGENFA